MDMLQQKRSQLNQELLEPLKVAVKCNVPLVLAGLPTKNFFFQETLGLETMNQMKTNLQILTPLDSKATVGFFCQKAFLQRRERDIFLKRYCILFNCHLKE